MGWLGKGWSKVEGDGTGIDPSVLNEYAKTTYVNTQVTAVSNEVTVVSNELNTTKENVKKNSEDIKVTNGQVNERISILENKVDNIETTNETIDATVTELVSVSNTTTQKLNTTVEKVDIIENKTAVVETKVVEIENKNTELHTRLSTVEKETATILERVIEVAVNPNLLYNSTGMMNLNGYVSTVNTINYRDRYISDKDSFFYITGPNGPTGFVSQSVPVSGGKTYTFSGYFFTHGNPITINVGYQTENELNTINSIEVVNICNDQLFEGDWTFFEKTFTITDNNAINGMYLQIVQNGTNTTAECFIKKMKIEEGEKSTSWIAEITDPYQNQVAIGGLSAASFLR